MEVGSLRGERAPWTRTARTCRQLQRVKGGLWTLLVTRGIEPSNIAAGRTLCKSMVQRNFSDAVHSASSTIHQYRMFTFTTTLRQHGRDV